MHHYIARLCIWLVEWRHVTMLGHILGWKKFSSNTLFFIPYIFSDTFRKHSYHYTEVHFTSFLSGGFTTMAVVNSPQCGLLFNSWAFYYSILEHFGGATNQDATNLRHVIIAMYSNQLNKSPKIMHKRLDEWGNVGSLFAKSIQNWS